MKKHSGRAPPRAETPVQADKPAASIVESHPSLSNLSGAQAVAAMSAAHEILNDPKQPGNVYEAEYFAREVARRSEFEKLRAETPIQVLEVRAQKGTSHLGVMVYGGMGPARVFPLTDWRTDLIPLRVGDMVTIVVLVGEALKNYLDHARIEQQAKEQPATVGGDPVGTGSGGV